MSEGNDKTKEISRREFLKLSGAGLGAITLDKSIKKLSGTKETENQKPERIIVETKNATYIPFYEEKHSRRITLEEIKQSPAQDVYFYESAYPSYLNDVDDANEALTSEGYTFTEAIKEAVGIEFTPTRTSPPEILDHFHSQDTFISYEGVELPPEIFKQELLNRLATAPLIGLSGIRSYHDLKKFISKEKINLKDILISTGVYSSGVWASTPGLRAFYDMLPRSVPRAHNKNLLRFFQRFDNIVSHLHPEDFSVFFRDALMARKLQTIGNEVDKFKKIDKKPRVGYQVHTGHGGIEDFLVLGDVFPLLALSFYSDKFLKKIIAHNGHPGANLDEQIDTFCKTLVVPVRGNLKEGKNIKHFIHDDFLKHYLNTRLKSS